MRILLYAYEYPPLGGGVGNALQNLFFEFSKYQDLEIDFVTSSLDNKFTQEKLFPNITKYSLAIGERKEADLHKQKPIHMLTYTWKAYWFTWKLLLSRKKYHLTHFFGFPGGLVCLLFRWRWRYIISLRGIDVPGYNPRFQKFMFFYKPLSGLIWLLASQVTANSAGLKALARETLKRKRIQVIPNGVDTEAFKPALQKYPIFSVTAGGTLFGRKKGLEYLIQGFAGFNDVYPDSHLNLIGSGDLEEEYRGLIRKLNKNDVITLMGRRSKTWIQKELPKHHVFCLPSLNEGMSNAALEALASGLPLLLTDTGGTSEILEDGVNGYIIDPKSPRDIAEKLKYFYENPEIAHRLGVESRKRAEGMSWRKVAVEYVEVYRQFAKL